MKPKREFIEEKVDFYIPAESTMHIDKVINILQKAKKAGATHIDCDVEYIENNYAVPTINAIKIRRETPEECKKRLEFYKEEERKKEKKELEKLYSLMRKYNISGAPEI